MKKSLLLLLLIFFLKLNADMNEGVYYIYTGTIGSNPVEITLVKTNEKVYGTYHYKKYLNTLTIKGFEFEEKYLVCKEYDINGQQTGNLEFRVDEEDSLSGEWINLDRTKSIPLKAKRIEIPNLPAIEVGSILFDEYYIRLIGEPVSFFDPTTNIQVDTLISFKKIEINIAGDKRIFEFLPDMPGLNHLYLLSSVKKNNNYYFLFYGIGYSNFNVQGECGAGGIESYLFSIDYNYFNTTNKIKTIHLNSCREEIYQSPFRNYEDYVTVRFEKYDLSNGFAIFKEAIFDPNSTSPEINIIDNDLLNIGYDYYNDKVCDQSGESCAEHDVLFPLFGSGDDFLLGALINTFISDLMAQPVIGEDALPDVEDVIDNYNSVFLEYVKDSEENLTGWDWKRELSIDHLSEKYLSLKQFENTYMGGTRENEQITYYVVDLDTGEVNLTDIIKDEHKNELLEIAEQQFRIQKGISNSTGLYSAGYSFKNGKFSLPDNFSVRSTGLIFYYNSNEIAPYSYGPTTLYLDYNKIKDVLNDDLADYIFSLIK